MSDENSTSHNTEQTSQEGSGNTSNTTGMAIVGTIPFLFFVPLLTESKDNEFVKFHAKQGLVLLVYIVSVSILGSILALIPILGWAIGAILIPLLYIFGLICFVLGIIHAAEGKKKELPIIGKYGRNFDF